MCFFLLTHCCICGRKPLLPLVVAEEPKPTRFEWPENHSPSEANLPHNLTGDSFEHLSYNSKVDLKPFTDAKPVISEGSISKMPETSLVSQQIFTKLGLLYIMFSSIFYFVAYKIEQEGQIFNCGLKPPL